MALIRKKRMEEKDMPEETETNTRIENNPVVQETSQSESDTEHNLVAFGNLEKTSQFDEKEKSVLVVKKRTNKKKVSYNSKIKLKKS